MAQSSKIEWTGYSWNPVTGCSKISSGCNNCYAERMAKRLQAMGNPRYADGFRVKTHIDLISVPKKWIKPRAIFVNSMSDLFHESISDEFIFSIFNTMNECPHHTFQVLTKRSLRLRKLSTKLNFTQNIWMGVTTEDPDNLYRIEDLKSCSAKIKFISCEPLLSSLPNLQLEGIDWVIVGGESGPNARPMQKEWAVEIKNKCQETDTPYFFKQWGGFNKKKSGRILDEVEWNQMPFITHFA